MELKVINIIDWVIQNKTELNVDQKVNYIYNRYDIGLSLMNEIRDYIKMNKSCN